nr:PREDICTED: uncharacterized protein LOC109029539 isoform X1 [Bemisia tabaci]
MSKSRTHYSALCIIIFSFAPVVVVLSVAARRRLHGRRPPHWSRFSCPVMYTGHCPTLKFRFGKRYGANTKEILQELTDIGVLKRHRATQYRFQDPVKAVLPHSELRPILRNQGQTRDLKIDATNRCRPYILGYTGYIPGMHFRYGTSFRQAADECYDELTMRLAEDQSRHSYEKSHPRVRSAPKLISIRSRDQVKQALKQYAETHRYRDHHISPEFPPIAGYTGHIPKLKVTDASLSQRYHTAAKKGLTLLKQERESLRDYDSKRLENALSTHRLTPVKAA